VAAVLQAAGILDEDRTPSYQPLHIVHLSEPMRREFGAWFEIMRHAAPLPDFAALRRALDSDEPAEALLAALPAFHAVRIWQLATIRLTDIRDGRLFLAGGARDALPADRARALDQ
jgi:hypothetical protein